MEPKASTSRFLGPSTTRMRHAAAIALLALVAGETDAQSPTTRTVALPAPTATLPAEFTMAASVRELADGRLLIVDRSERRLVVADWRNAQVTPLGRSGSGPGEYLQPTTLFAIGGDSTILPDTRNGRWLLLHGASIASTTPPDAPAIASGARLPLGADDRGNVIITRASGVGGGALVTTTTPDSILLLRISRSTGRADTVATVRARPARINVQGPPANPTSITIVSNALAVGEAAALCADGWIAIARLDPYRVEWITPDGRHILGPPLPFERVRLDERERRVFLEREAARTGRATRDPASLPEWPEFMPPYLSGALLCGFDGRLWIRRTPTAEMANPPYDVVDRRGALVARVSRDTDVEVVGFGRGVVYTVVTDADGIQRVQRRPLPGF